MRVGLHLSPRCPEGQSLAQGFEALGWRVQWRNGSQYKAGQVESFDAVACAGARGNRADLLADYTAHGIPALCVDFGYIKRHNEQDTDHVGYYSLGLGKLGWVPASECPADRWRALGVRLAKPHKGEVTVIAGQMLGDAAHPFADAAQMEAWALERASGVDGPVVFRPHPRSPHVAPRGLEIDTLPLAESLARASKVITYNSNIGHDALIAGVPVQCSGVAPYAFVTLASRREYFHRLAYAQWRLPEIASGQAVEFILRASHDD